MQFYLNVAAAGHWLADTLHTITSYSVTLWITLITAYYSSHAAVSHIYKYIYTYSIHSINSLIWMYICMCSAKPLWTTSQTSMIHELMRRVWFAMQSDFGLFLYISSYTYTRIQWTIFESWKYPFSPNVRTRYSKNILKIRFAAWNFFSHTIFVPFEPSQWNTL